MTYQNHSSVPCPRPKFVRRTDLSPVIRMFVNDHPPAHFHAEYQGHEALFNIHSLEIVKGKFPKRARLLVIEWALEHRQELIENWNEARKPAPLHAIEPLE